MSRVNHNEKVFRNYFIPSGSEEGEKRLETLVNCSWSKEEYKSNQASIKSLWKKLDVSFLTRIAVWIYRISSGKDSLSYLTCMAEKIVKLAKQCGVVEWNEDSLPSPTVTSPLSSPSSSETRSRFSSDSLLLEPEERQKTERNTVVYEWDVYDPIEREKIRGQVIEKPFASEKEREKWEKKIGFIRPAPVELSDADIRARFIPSLPLSPKGPLKQD